MDIRVLDGSALADDAVMREFYDLERRSGLHGREQAPFWPFEEFLGAYRSVDSGERQELFAVYDDDRMVAVATLWTTLLEDLDKVFFEVSVDVTERRRGIGRALVARIEETARAAGRRLAISTSKLPYDDRDDHPHQRFAEACGYERYVCEVVRHLRLPVADEAIQKWIDAAQAESAGYTIETFVGAVPDELVESLCLLIGQLGADAPSGDVDFDEADVTPQRYAEMLDSAAAMNRVRYETVALTPDRQVVAQSTLAVPLGDSPTHVYQWGTFVHRDHRGHRLGLATKAVNLRAIQAARSDLTLVITQNAETNDHMVAINDLIGFYPVEVSAEYVKRLSAD